MLINLDIDQLRAFATVSRTGSFTRTGELLGRTQSAISLQIKRLETSIERKLFERNGRSIGLTNAGERFLVEANHILEMHDRAITLLNQPAVSGNVSLGCTEEFAAVHLTDVLGSFQRTHQNVHIEIAVDTSQELRKGFSNNRYDVVLAKTTQDETNGQSIWREDLIWVIDNKTLSASILLRDPLPLLVSPLPCLIRHAMTTALDNADRKWTIVGTSEVNAGLQAAVLAGFGVTALPRSAIQPGIRQVLPEEGLPTLPQSEVRMFENPNDGNDAARCLAGHIISRITPTGVYG